jgi:hypothetical protein
MSKQGGISDHAAQHGGCVNVAGPEAFQMERHILHAKETQHEM